MLFPLPRSHPCPAFFHLVNSSFGSTYLSCPHFSLSLVLFCKPSKYCVFLSTYQSLCPHLCYTQTNVILPQQTMCFYLIFLTTIILITMPGTQWMLKKYLLNERMNDHQHWRNMAIIKNFGEVGGQQNEGGAHTICITHLASFWGIKFWNRMWLSQERRGSDCVA